MIKIESFKIIGITVKTTNENGKAARDLGMLWNRFFAEDITNKVPDKIGSEIYSIYTDYESNFKGQYTTIIGLKVNSLDNIPSGLTGRTFEAETFEKYIAKGEMPKAVAETWEGIWKKDDLLNRKYTYDFEVYTERSQNGENSEVEIFIATKN